MDLQFVAYVAFGLLLWHIILVIGEYVYDHRKQNKPQNAKPKLFTIEDVLNPNPPTGLSYHGWKQYRNSIATEIINGS